MSLATAATALTTALRRGEPYTIRTRQASDTVQEIHVECTAPESRCFTFSVYSTTGLTDDEKKELERYVVRKLDEVFGRDSRPACVATVQFVDGGTVKGTLTRVGSDSGRGAPPRLEFKSATAEVFWSWTAAVNRLRKLAWPKGSHLPAVTHSFAETESLARLIQSLSSAGGGGVVYSPNQVRIDVAQYNAYLDVLHRLEEAKAEVHSAVAAATDTKTLDAEVQDTRRKMQELWQRIVERDRLFVKALEADAKLAKDTTQRALQELYTNARERIQQEAQRTETASAGTLAAPSSTGAKLDTRAASDACACSLSDLGDKIKDKTTGH